MLNEIKKVLENENYDNKQLEVISLALIVNLTIMYIGAILCKIYYNQN